VKLAPAADSEGFAFGTSDAVPGFMIDVLMVLAAAAFFALGWAYVRLCEKL
jgi:hypothetical protein